MFRCDRRQVAFNERGTSGKCREHGAVGAANGDARFKMRSTIAERDDVPRRAAKLPFLIVAANSKRPRFLTAIGQRLKCGLRAGNGELIATRVEAAALAANFHKDVLSGRALIAGNLRFAARLGRDEIGT